MTNERILQKIEKLLRKAESANQHEAQAFAAKAMALMGEHKVTMEDVELQRYNDSNPIDGERVNDHDTPNSSRIDAFAIDLAEAVANSMGVKITFYRGSSALKFWGRMEQRKIAVYLFKYLYNFAVKERDTTYNRLYQRWHYKKRKGQISEWEFENENPMVGWKASWNEGFIRELRKRVREEFKKPFDKAEREFAIVVRDDLKAVTEYMEKAIPNLRSSEVNGRYGGNEQGFYAGKMTAQDVAIHRGVEGGKRNRQKQLTS